MVSARGWLAEDMDNPVHDCQRRLPAPVDPTHKKSAKDRDVDLRNRKLHPAMAMDIVIADACGCVQLPLENVAYLNVLADEQETGARCVQPMGKINLLVPISVRQET